MRLISLSLLAYEVSHAGGLGYIGAGSDVSTLAAELDKFHSLCSDSPTLSSYYKETRVTPVGVGFLLWGGKALLDAALPILAKHCPATVWLFAPRQAGELKTWAQEVRRVTQGKSKIWIQVGTVADAVEATALSQPDVLVVQGTEAGGHGLEKCAGLVSLLPEVDDAVTNTRKDNGIKKPALIAAGGIADGRGAAAALTLGAFGVVMGTRYLASPEANVSKGYQNAVIQASDGGVTTARGKLYDQLRGTTDWPDHYGGRGVLNHSWFDAAKGVSAEENKRLYDEALAKGDAGWGSDGRLTTYAGAGVGLVKSVTGAGAITDEVRSNARRVIQRAANMI